MFPLLVTIRIQCTTASETLLCPYMVHPLCVHQRWRSEKSQVPTISPDGGEVGVCYVCCLFHCTMSGCQVRATCCPADKEDGLK